MKKILEKAKRPLCGVIVIICLLLMLGCTGTAELGGDLITYCIQGTALLGTAITSGIVGGIFE